jgi:thioredoxin-dependent peroxiredoxin
MPLYSRKTISANEEITMVEVGDLAPKFCLPSSNQSEVCLNSYKGKWVVLYFYPKDNTSGCTREALDFTSHTGAFHSLCAEVIGISKDSTESHRKFSEKHGLKITLLSDSDHKVIEAYGVWALKKMYGKESYGVVRSTFLIDPQGKIARIWRAVKVNGHVEAVMEALEEQMNR